ncbi:MAG: O-antigen ligase family protein [Patescibacteria group bacterium]|nr:O-antigen ligase family protein [Patescibacteria group bacterium]MDD3939514.1 O-antigen ligase family protein [Patescibacteria group bacterium]MDD4443739.1 O-antigen ligase family protein [Patescibacteria group bacterium]NCU39675.1 hypothetical protein [Candidatus Falkowbacteria bacterium]
MSAKKYLRILQGGIILSLLVVLFVFPSLLFPYISSKQLVFNILMELLFALWLVFIWKYPSYRPKFNFLVYSLAAYLLVILISSIFGIDFNLSFWGDVERMLGFFHILHFFLFFIILISVFRQEKDWRLLLNFSLIIATLVALIGLLGEKPHSTIGNTTYVSGYIIFNLFFAAILFFRSRSSWRYIYFLPTLILLLQFKEMRTSGAIIGLAISILVALILIAILHRNKKLKITLFSLVGLAILSLFFIFSQQEASWFQNSFLKNLTSQKATFQTRLLSWQSAAKAFPQQPLLGTGFGNYAVIFDKYFNPVFFNYDKNETYFDRAHNNLIDIASTTGILGLVTYLSIFVFVAFYIISLWRRQGWHIDKTPLGRKNLELVLLTALFIAYFVQNLAVFDSLVTYMGLMMALGFIYFLYENKMEDVLQNEVKNIEKRGETFVLMGVLILALIVINQFNIKPWRTLEGVIAGYTKLVSGEVIDGLDIFQQSLKDGPLDRDGRSSLLNLIISNPIILTSFTEEKAKNEFSYLESLALKNLEHNPQDSLFLLQTAQLYDLGSRVFASDLELKDKYSNLALDYTQKALISSPGRIPIYFVKAQIMSFKGDNAAALEVLEYAQSLNYDYADTSCRLAPLYKEMNRKDDAIDAYYNCIDNGVTSKLGGVNSLIEAAEFLVENEEYERSIVVLEELVKSYDSDPNMWFNLAQLYLLVEDDELKAREAANQAIVLDPSFVSKAEMLFSK